MSASKYRRAQRELEHAEKEIQRLSEKIDTLNAHADELRSFLSVWERLGDDDEPEQPGNGGGPAVPLAKRDLPQLEAVRILLRQVGTPLSPSEMADKLLEGGYRYDSGAKKLGASIRGILSKKLDEDPEIVRIKRGVYGLAEWEDDQQPSILDGNSN